MTIDKFQMVYYISFEIVDCHLVGRGVLALELELRPLACPVVVTLGATKKVVFSAARLRARE